MRLRSTPLAFSATTLLLLAGCSQLGAPMPSAAHAPGGACHAPPAQAFVGHMNTAQTLEQARLRSGAAMARVLHPGQPTTREFNAERLNLEVDATGRITAARCG